MAPPVFELVDVVVATDAGTAILDIGHLAVPDDGITVIAGRSGAGKSTLLRLCNRLEVPTSGTVRYRGEDLADLDPLVVRRRVGMVFQRAALFPGTVRDNLRVARPDGDDDELTDALLRAGLSQPFLDRIGDDLSGGEAQRTCLARTLLTGPSVLLMDEPTSALDQGMTEQLERSVRSLADEEGVAVLWVSHDLGQVERLGDRIVVLEEGRVIEVVDPAPRKDTDRTPRNDRTPAPPSRAPQDPAAADVGTVDG